MSVDCEKRQTADGWRRNSQKWGSQGWEGGPTSPPCGIPQTPPPIPAPPSSDPQDCLTKKTSVILKEPPGKKEAPSTEAFFSNNEQNSNATEKETKFWWEMDDEEPEPSPVVDIPRNKKFFWEEEEEEADENNGNTVKQNEYSDEERESSSPWRRSRSRTNSPPRTTTFQLAAPPTGRSRQSRNTVRDINCPTGDTSRQSTSPQVRRRSRPPSNEPESVSDSCSSVPIRRRQRNTENEVPNGPSQVSESNRSSSPPVRRRTREVKNENEVGDQQTGNEVSYPVRTRSRSRALQTQENNGISERTTESDSTYPVRIRSRSRALESPQNNINSSETTQENHSTTDSPVRRRSRNASSQGQVNDEEVERPNSTSPPLRTRVRNPSEETKSISQSGEELAQPPLPSGRRRIRPIVREEDSIPQTETVTHRRRRIGNTENKEVQKKGDDTAISQTAEPQMAVSLNGESRQEKSPEPELWKSSLQVELKTPSTSNATQTAIIQEPINEAAEHQNSEKINTQDTMDNSKEVPTATIVLRRKRNAPTSKVAEKLKSSSNESVEESKDQPIKLDEESAPTVVIHRRRSSTNSEVDHPRATSREGDVACNRRRPSDSTSVNEDQQIKSEVLDEEPPTTVVIRKRPPTPTSEVDLPRTASSERDVSLNRRRSSNATSVNEDQQTKSGVKLDEEPPTTVVIRKRRPTPTSEVDQPRTASSERDVSLNRRRSSTATSVNEDQQTKSGVKLDEEPPTTVFVRRRSTPNSETDQPRTASRERDILNRRRPSNTASGNEDQTKSEVKLNEEPPTTVFIGRRSSPNSDQPRTSSSERDVTLNRRRSSNTSLGNEDKQTKLEVKLDEEPPTTVVIRKRRSTPNSDLFEELKCSSKEKEDGALDNRRLSNTVLENQDQQTKSIIAETNSNSEVAELLKRDSEVQEIQETPRGDFSDDSTAIAALEPISNDYKNKSAISEDDEINCFPNEEKPEEEDWGEDSKNGNEDKELESFEWDDFNEIEEVDEDKQNEDNKEVVEEEEEDEVAKATRIWLENQNARLLGVPLPMKIINLTEEEMKFDPLQKLETENIPTAYETWDAEPADQEVSPEFLNKKLRKVEKPDYDLRSQTTRSRRNRTEENGIKIPSDETPSDIPLPPPPPPPSKSSKVPPPPPPPPPIAPPMSKKDKEVKRAREDMVESIKKAARSRPDWHSVMKDIEGGIKLRKIGNDMKSDRSRPILPNSRGKGGKFVYESEKPMMHNQMLEQIQRGVRLRHVRTNDRSRPDFNRLGIRKLRRQVTTDEKKTVDPDTPDALPSSSDEEEDIDQMRDDLQSTKTQLAEEIKKTKKIERENKILKIDIDSLQAEVKRMKRRLKEAGINEAKPLANGEADAIAPKLSKSMSKLRMREEDMNFSELDDIEEDIKILNEQIEAQRKRAEQAEQKCEELTQKMQVADNSTDEWELRSIYFEKKFKSLQKDQGIELPDINCIGTQTETVEISSAPEGPGALPTKKSQSRKSFGKLNRMESFKEEETEESSSDEEESLSEAAEGEEEEVQEELESEDEEVSAERKAENESIKRERELKLWHNKLGHAKEKIKNVKRERNNLRDRIKKYYKDMRKEREEYLKVKAELKEMADQMKEDEESVIDDSYEPTDDSEEDSVQQDEEDPEWWCEDAPKKPKKKLKKRKRKIISEEKQEEILNNDEPNDMSDLADPEWPGTDDADSETDDEEEDIKLRIKKLKDRVDLQEQHLNEKKKDTYLLKAQIDQCDEKYGDERRRNARINNELQLLFADI